MDCHDPYNIRSRNSSSGSKSIIRNLAEKGFFAKSVDILFQYKNWNMNSKPFSWTFSSNSKCIQLYRCRYHKNKSSCSSSWYSRSNSRDSARTLEKNSDNEQFICTVQGKHAPNVRQEKKEGTSKINEQREVVVTRDMQFSSTWFSP